MHPASTASSRRGRYPPVPFEGRSAAAGRRGMLLLPAELRLGSSFGSAVPMFPLAAAAQRSWLHAHFHWPCSCQASARASLVCLICRSQRTGGKMVSFLSFFQDLRECSYRTPAGDPAFPARRPPVSSCCHRGGGGSILNPDPTPQNEEICVSPLLPASTNHGAVYSPITARLEGWRRGNMTIHVCCRSGRVSWRFGSASAAGSVQSSCYRYLTVKRACFFMFEQMPPSLCSKMLERPPGVPACRKKTAASFSSCRHAKLSVAV